MNVKSLFLFKTWWTPCILYLGEDGARHDNHKINFISECAIYSMLHHMHAPSPTFSVNIMQVQMCVQQLIPQHYKCNSKCLLQAIKKQQKINVIESTTAVYCRSTRWRKKLESPWYNHCNCCSRQRARLKLERCWTPKNQAYTIKCSWHQLAHCLSDSNRQTD